MSCHTHGVLNEVALLEHLVDEHDVWPADASAAKLHMLVHQLEALEERLVDALEDDAT